jgi:hypothetical protein
MGVGREGIILHPLLRGFGDILHRLLWISLIQGYIFNTI